MSRIAYGITIGALGVLVFLLALLLFDDPDFSTEATTIEGDREPVSIPELHVQCGSVGTVGWAGDGANLDTSMHGSTSFHIEPSVSLPKQVFDAMAYGFDQECNERRDTNTAYAIVLVIPASVLSVLAVTRIPRPVVDDQPETTSTGPGA